VRILEMDGPKGGRITVLLLACNSWVTRRLKAGAPPPVAVWCIACHVRKHLAGKLALVAPAPPARRTH
jgi:Flp pilus assembly protein TadB